MVAVTHRIEHRGLTARQRRQTADYLLNRRFVTDMIATHSTTAKHKLGIVERFLAIGK